MIYSAALRAELRRRIPEDRMNTPEAQQALLTLVQNAFPLHMGNSYVVEDPRLPWGRSFEWDFDLQPR